MSERIPTSLKAWLAEFGTDFGYHPERSDVPCRFEPGSEERIAVLARRYTEGRTLLMDGDRINRNGITGIVEDPLKTIWRGNPLWGAEYSEPVRIDSNTDEMVSLYRYRLWMRWDESKPIPAFIGLNPSTATESKLDSTMRRIKAFCLRFGYGGFEMLNLFGYRSTDPKGLEQTADPIGPGNDRAIITTVRRSSFVICCWGNDGAKYNRAARVLWALSKSLSRSKVYCFGLNGLMPSRFNPERLVGSPKHPLYLPNDAVIIPMPWDQVDVNDDKREFEQNGTGGGFFGFDFDAADHGDEDEFDDEDTE